MKIEEAQVEYKAYMEKQQVEKTLRKQREEEKLEQKFAKYKTAIENYIDQKIRDNYSSSVITIGLLQLAKVINFEDSLKKTCTKEQHIGDYVALLYRKNGFKTEFKTPIIIDDCVYDSYNVLISGWKQ